MNKHTYPDTIEKEGVPESENVIEYWDKDKLMDVVTVESGESSSLQDFLELDEATLRPTTVTKSILREGLDSYKQAKVEAETVRELYGEDEKLLPRDAEKRRKESLKGSRCFRRCLKGAEGRTATQSS